MGQSKAAVGILVLALVLAMAGCHGGGQATAQGPGEAAATGTEAASASVTVDAQGRGDYRSIQEGIEAAPAGGTVRVRAGIYHECLEIRKPIFIEGEGAGKTIVVSNTPWAGSMAEFRAKFEGLKAQGGDEARQALDDLVHQYGRPAVLVADTEAVTLRGLKLTLLSPGGEGLSVADGCVMLNKAKAELSNCVVAGAWTYGVDVGEGSGLKLHDSLVVAVLNCGVEVKGQEGMGPVELTATDFRWCAVGVEIAADCQTTVKDCRFLACAHAGVRYQESAPAISHCAFVQAHQGVTGWSQGAVSIRDSVFCLSDAFAVSVGSSAKAEIVNNTFASNAFGVVVLQRPYGATIRANIFSDDGVGVLLPQAGAAPDGTEPQAEAPPAGGEGPQTSAEAGVGTQIKGNLFWHSGINVGEAAKDSVTGATATRSLTLPTGNEVTNPIFRGAPNLDYALQPGSPALLKRIGAPAPLSSDSKWPDQVEETRMPRDEDQPMGTAQPGNAPPAS